MEQAGDLPLTLSELLRRLLADEKVRARAGDWLNGTPQGRCRAWDRVEGMLLGLAIGDALGNRCEGLVPEDRQQRYGEIRDFLPNRHLNGERRGTPSDDSQMAFGTADELVTHGRLEPASLAQRLALSRIFGIGNTVRQFQVRHTFDKMPGWEAGPESAGNGALMRIAPVVLPHLRSPSPALWHDAAIAAMITHNDSAAIASAVAYVGIVWVGSDSHSARVGPN